MSEKLSSMATTESDEGYAAFERLVAERVAAATGPLFTTDADPDALWDGYLGRLPERQQHYKCHCCRRFLQNHGHLVRIDTDGDAYSLLWSLEGVPEFFQAAVENLRMQAENAKVTGVFVSAEPVWGVPRTGNWTHLCGKPPKLHSHALLSASQSAAEKKADFGMLCHALADYSVEAASQAVRVLEQGGLYRSEKAVAVANWFHDLHRQLHGVHGRRRQNLIWLAVATAPVGFCHVRSTIISTLLDDIKAGLGFSDISNRWKSKLHPLQYQRPTKAPTAGAIDQAEGIFEKLALAPALARRYATLADVQVRLWEPQPELPTTAPTGGLFGHLRSSSPSIKEVELPPQKITWGNFRAKVLPTAKSMDVVVPSSGGFYGLVTAADPTAPPLLQWDSLEQRNPVSWYFYHNGSTADRWNLRSGAYAAVTTVFLPPCHWHRPDHFQQHGQKVFFALANCRDLYKKAGLALFPECLRSELHGVRAVIEAHSGKGEIVGAEEGTANGLALQPNGVVTVRVQGDGGSASYIIDRFE